MRPWPKNPQQAGPRDPVDIACRLMVTLLMAMAMIVTGVISKLGEDKRPVGALFFAATEESREVMERFIVITEKSNESDASQSTQDVMQLMPEYLTALQRFKDPFWDVRHGQVWRLVTPIFLHFGVIHLVFNLMWLWKFGQLLEIRFRSMRFLGLVLWVAVTSNVAQAWWGGAAFGGMSGVNYGLFGFIWLRALLHPSPDFAMHRSTIFWMMLWLVLCMTGSAGPVANAAHLVGFLAGAVAGTGNALMNGGWQKLKRRQQFRAAMSSSANTLHRCATCGKTEDDDASLEFYVSATDGEEYCVKHLPENRS